MKLNRFRKRSQVGFVILIDVLKQTVLLHNEKHVFDKFSMARYLVGQTFYKINTVARSNWVTVRQDIELCLLK